MNVKGRRKCENHQKGRVRKEGEMRQSAAGPPGPLSLFRLKFPLLLLAAAWGHLGGGECWTRSRRPGVREAEKWSRGLCICPWFW